eukprot:TRINITY_DN4879_c1_g1_i3.p1 TRINITY_DN4879_c1_g1~~TRINITY_DN4879_c1_g1_i3.p1  ORF type:complete len:129 (-),score=32.43 TRINITY_DN4879_c1_g1_i3:310-696(-)
MSMHFFYYKITLLWCRFNEEALPPLPIQYLDYSIHERQQMVHFQRGLDYWNKQLAKIPKYPPPLPLSTPVASKKQTTGFYPFLLPKQITTKIQQFIQKSHTTLFSTLQSVVGLVLFHQLMNSQDSGEK